MTARSLAPKIPRIGLLTQRGFGLGQATIANTDAVRPPDPADIRRAGLPEKQEDTVNLDWDDWLGAAAQRQIRLSRLLSSIASASDWIVS